MSLKNINTAKAPEAVGPYNQAVIAGNMLFISGQIALDPATGELISGDVGAQTRQCMKNVLAILEEAGLDEKALARVGIYVTSMDNFALVNQVYASFFKGNYPARACVEVSGLPKGADVEIEAVALLG